MSDARSAYLSGRAGGPPPPDTRSQVDKDQGFTSRAQAAYDAGKAESDRERRIKNAMKRERDRDPNIGGLTNEELKKIQDQADRSDKNPYNVSTEGGITTLGEETTRRQTPTLAESVNDYMDNVSIYGKVGTMLNAILDKAFQRNIEKSTLTDPNKLAVLEARIRRGDLGKGTKTLEQELFDKDGEYFDLVNELFADDLKDKENIEKYGQDVTAEDILRGNLEKAGLAADPNITFRFDEEAAKEKFKNMPATNRDKVDLANLPTTGPNAIKDPELRRKIFDARTELNRDDRNPFTGVKDDGGITTVNVDGEGGGDESTDDTDPDEQFYGYNLGPAEITYPGSESVFVDPSQGPLQSLFANNYQGDPNNVGIATAADGMFVDNKPSLPLKLQDIKYEKRTNMMRNMDRIQPETNVMQGNMDLAPNLNRGI